MNCSFSHLKKCMNFNFDAKVALQYKSSSQKIRVMSESWVADNIFCPSCGCMHLSHLSNNMPVADFQCGECGELYELKSKKGKIGKKIVDGAYSTMIERITDANNPNLFVMEYSDDLQVRNLILIPKFFLVPSVIEKRNSLRSDARRAGWTGCNILYYKIPEQGKIMLIDDQRMSDRSEVITQYARVKKLKSADVDNQTWLLDVLSCVNLISKTEFSLQDVYKFTRTLQIKHNENHNIEAKIRQQLQILRDRGYIEFLGRGQYRKI